MTAAPAPSHAADHGVRAFDPGLAAATMLGRGRFNLKRTNDGRYYVYLEVDTLLGHLCAAVHLEGRHAEQLGAAERTGAAPASNAPINVAAHAVIEEIEHVGQGLAQRASRRVRHFQHTYNAYVTPFTGDSLLVEDGLYGPKTRAALGHVVEGWAQSSDGDVVAGAADEALGVIGMSAAAAAQALANAAAARATAPAVLHAARLVVRAHMGDDAAKQTIRSTLDAARAGDVYARKRVRLIAAGRRFAREVLGAHPTTTGSLFSDLGHTISHAVKAVSHEVTHVEHSIAKAAGTVVKVIKRFGPMILADIQGLVSLIPGIGTGISAAISAAEAVLSGGGIISIALHLAYGALPIPPGLRSITDIVLDTVIELVKNPKHFVDVGLQVIRDRIPKGLPQEIFDSLVKIVVKHQPILKVVGGAIGHYVGAYTAGATSAIAHGLEHVSAPVQGLLAKLPDAKTAFKSIHHLAPHFAIAAAAVPALLTHAQLAAGVQLDPDHAAALTAHVSAAVVQHAQDMAAQRLAQRTHVTPHEAPSPASPGANVGVETSADGSSQRVVTSSGLAHMIPQISAPAV